MKSDRDPVIEPGFRPPPLDLPLASSPMAAVLCAQFLSALADNAMLVAAIALLKAQSSAGLVPLLQQAFLAPFVLLAPFVGPFADSLPKGRVMLIANSVKLAGALAMVLGLLPVAAYAIVGIGAAAYSPAKYGILAQLFAPARLVKANGMLEGSTIVAILLGVPLGGLVADVSVDLALWAIAGTYLLATISNLFIPRLPREHPLNSFEPVRLARDFGVALRTLYGNTDARFSLLGTAVFWGSGTTLRLMLFAWVPFALGVADNQTPAYLMGVVSIGIVLGAVLAGAFVRIETVNRALIGGLAIGPLVMLLAGVDSMPSAGTLLVLVGLCGGLFVVPLNALLQERGLETVGTGRALAVQNFSENLCMLLFVGIYMLATRAGAPIDAAVAGFGGLILLALAALAAARLRSGRAAKGTY